MEMNIFLIAGLFLLLFLRQNIRSAFFFLKQYAGLSDAGSGKFIGVQRGGQSIARCTDCLCNAHLCHCFICITCSGQSPKDYRCHRNRKHSGNSHLPPTVDAVCFCSEVLHKVLLCSKNCNLQNFPAPLYFSRVDVIIFIFTFAVKKIPFVKILSEVSLF